MESNINKYLKKASLLRNESPLISLYKIQNSLENPARNTHVYKVIKSNKNRKIIMVSITSAVLLISAFIFALTTNHYDLKSMKKASSAKTNTSYQIDKNKTPDQSIVFRSEPVENKKKSFESSEDELKIDSIHDEIVLNIHPGTISIPDINIGNINLSFEDMKKVYNDLSKELNNLHLTTLEELSREFTTYRFDNEIETEAKKLSGTVMPAKVKLYGYITKNLSKSIIGINRIVLSWEELKKLNIIIDGDSINFEMENISYHANSESFYDYNNSFVLDDYGYDTLKLPALIKEDVVIDVKRSRFPGDGVVFLSKISHELNKNLNYFQAHPNTTLVFSEKTNPNGVRNLHYIITPKYNYGRNLYGYSISVPDSDSHYLLNNISNNTFIFKDNQGPNAKRVFHYFNPPQYYNGWGLDSFSKIVPVSFRIYTHYDKDWDTYTSYNTPLLDSGFFNNRIKFLSKKFNELSGKHDSAFISSLLNGNFEDFIISNYGQDFSKINLVPIDINFPIPEKDRTPENARYVTKVTLWFVPTQEFISALPERYKNPLRKEVGIMRQLENKEVTYEQACKGLSNQESIFDICRQQSGALKEIKIYPNPAKQSSNGEFMLLEGRSIRITLHDVDGRYISTLEENPDIQPGIHKFSINLETINPGMYLIAVQSDKGEQIVSRIMKQ